MVLAVYLGFLTGGLLLLEMSFIYFLQPFYNPEYMIIPHLLWILLFISVQYYYTSWDWDSSCSLWEHFKVNVQFSCRGNEHNIH